MRVLARAGLAVAFVAVGASGAPARAVEHGASSLPVEPVPEALVESSPANETQRLLASARETKSLCAVIGAIERLREPHPGKAEELLSWAVRYHAAMTTLDPDGRVRDGSSREPEREVDVPSEAVAAVLAQRRSVYAYAARVRIAMAYEAAGVVDRAGLQLRLDDAWRRLLLSPFTEAAKTLVGLQARYCND